MCSCHVALGSWHMRGSDTLVGGQLGGWGSENGDLGSCRATLSRRLKQVSCGVVVMVVARSERLLTAMTMVWITTILSACRLLRVLYLMATSQLIFNTKSFQTFNLTSETTIKEILLRQQTEQDTI